jgi:hypothetical protein
VPDAKPDGTPPEAAPSSERWVVASEGRQPLHCLASSDAKIHRWRPSSGVGSSWSTVPILPFGSWGATMTDCERFAFPVPLALDDDGGFSWRADKSG